MPTETTSAPEDTTERITEVERPLRRAGPGVVGRVFSVERARAAIPDDFDCEAACSALIIGTGCDGKTFEGLSLLQIYGLLSFAPEHVREDYRERWS